MAVDNIIRRSRPKPLVMKNLTETHYITIASFGTRRNLWNDGVMSRVKIRYCEI